MAPTKTGGTGGEENSPRSSAVENIFLRGRGPPTEPGGLIGATLWRRRWRPLRSGNEVYGTADSPRGAEEMGPTKTGAKDREEKSPRSSAENSLSLRGGRLTAEPRQTHRCHNLWRRRWRPIGRGDKDDGKVDSPRGGEEMASTEMGTKDWEENSRRSSAAKEPLPEGGRAAR